MEFESEAGIWAKADATVFRLLMGENRTERRATAAERTIVAAHKRVGIVRRLRAARIAREQAWGRPIRVRHLGSNRAAKPDHAWRRQRLNTAPARRAIRAYAAPLVDARGRVAIYFQVKYLGLKSKKWRPGLSAAHIDYILRDEALEKGTDGQIQNIQSNMGETIEEIAAAWDALEELEQAYRANATVQYRIVWNLPHDLNPAQRGEMVHEFCERTFGRLGLPWVAAIHKPDAKGDQRNYHAHIAFSTRPCERTGNHEWDFALEKVTDLTDPDGLKLMRALAAAHMNKACRAAGKMEKFTHQTYAERGIDAVRQTHVGAARMAAHERGETIAIIEHNAKVVERNEAAVAEQSAAQMISLSKRLTALLAQSVEMGAKRARLAARIAVTRAIGEQCRWLVMRKKAKPQAKRSQFDTLARRIRSISTFRPACRRHENAKLVGIQRAVRLFDQGFKQRTINIERAALIRRHLEQINRAVDIQNTTRNERGKSLLMHAQVPPYTVDGSRVILNLSAMAQDDAALIRSMDRESLASAVRERQRADRERAEAEAKAKAAAQLSDQKRRTVEHDRQIAAACRILHHSAHRPYRWDGSEILPDLATLPAADRALITDIGFVEPRLKKALHKRAMNDEVADLDHLYEAIRRERPPLVEKNGRRTVTQEWLSRFTLRDEAICGTDAQRELELIAKEQAREKARIISHVQASPEHVLYCGERWTLNEAAPAAIRQLVDAWRHDDLMQALLEDHSNTFSADGPETTPEQSSDQMQHPVRDGAAGCDSPVPPAHKDDIIELATSSLNSENLAIRAIRLGLAGSDRGH